MEDLKWARQTLGISKSATRDEIKAAFRAVAKVHHPDVGGSAIRFGEAKRAYHVALRAARAVSSQTVSSQTVPSAVVRARPTYTQFTPKPSASRRSFADILAAKLGYA